MDSPKRSIAKAVVWELSGLLTLLVVGTLMLKQPVAIGCLAVVFYLVRIVMFFVHEQVWTRFISWGKVRRYDGRQK